jgi:DNA-binding Lrp family transcriptional regulator
VERRARRPRERYAGVTTQAIAFCCVFARYRLHDERLNGDPLQIGGIVDAIDGRVIGCLLRNARATLAEIGAEVGLSAPAVKRRIDRLVASGAIRGFTAQIDPDVLGWSTEAYVELYCKGTVAPQDLRRSLETVPEVVGAVTVSGEADALVHILASDVKQLERALERIRDEPNVDHTRSVIVLSRLIDRPRA